MRVTVLVMASGKDALMKIEPAPREMGPKVFELLETGYREE